MTQRRGIDLLRQGWPFALLCLAASSEGWITDTWPQAGSTLASETAACALAAALSFGLAFLKPKARPTRLSTSSTAWGGALILVGPAIGLFLMSSLGPANRVLALALTPVVVAVAEAALGTQEQGLSARSLWPGLAAVSGLLLVLPEPSLASPLNDAALLLAPLLTGIGCTLFRRHTLDAMDATTTFAGGCLLFGLGTVVQSALQHTLPVPDFAAVAIDLVLTLLSILALQRLTATQYVSRYVLVPLVILLLSLLQVHETITARSVTCAVLLAGAAISLLRQSDRRKDEPLNVVIG
ncbi:hypothetical protein [Granulicella mallensis]|uniref:EamA domain-containing protein n=1 Tax=Granulicella mallensis (strain ATCC BAA-1857 / DSM 23137 / MP5ACTX8) TaxID=682795 RepID=G8NRK3_GRAMM|nr:hypothetical protein [Granulicella mallensis]AEU37361.1 hypothetical protein AciX8_3058 [Granulicella mallensis MP5ACTX8]